MQQLSTAGQSHMRRFLHAQIPKHTKRQAGTNWPSLVFLPPSNLLLELPVSHSMTEATEEMASLRCSIQVRYLGTERGMQMVCGGAKRILVTQILNNIKYYDCLSISITGKTLVCFYILLKSFTAEY